MEAFDLIIIGTGSANIVADAAIEAGKRIAMIEKDRWGGTCLNRGCLPTKVLTTLADHMEASRYLEASGLKHEGLTVDWSVLGDRVWTKIDEHHDVLSYYQEAGVTTYTGTASFIDTKTVKVQLNAGDEVTLTSDTIIVSGGARTNIPEMEGLSDDLPYLNSERFFASREQWLKERPQSMVILGGGTIACEFAHVFASLGTHVTILQRNVRLLPKQDEAVSQTFLQGFKKRGMDVKLGVQTEAVDYEDGQFKITYKDKTSGELSSVTAESFFLAPGVRSNADLMKIETTGVELDERGYILTNEFLETSVEGIYAIGDINGKFQFRHKANQEAYILAHNLYQRQTDEAPRWMTYDAIPDVTYSWPQVASVGMTEEAAKKAFGEESIAVAIHPYSYTGKGYALGYDEKNEAFAKLIVERSTDRILGMHIVGYEASSLIQPYVDLINSRPRQLEVIEPSIEGPLARAYRVQELMYQPETWTTAFIDQSIVPHPSLAEIPAWATEYLE